jgi:hypothetical protein
MESQLIPVLQQLFQQIESLKKPQPSPHRSAELQELFTALAKAQAEMQTAELSATNPFFKTRYADLAAIVRASRPALTKHGLSIIQQILTHDDGHTLLHTMLCHNSGQWVESRVRIVPPKNDVQSMGSYITYLRRYSIAALCGIVSSDDDDGEIAMAPTRTPYTKTNASKYLSSEAISAQQLQELETELAQHGDIITLIKDGLKIPTLADMPKEKYQASLNRIRTIKASREVK